MKGYKYTIMLYQYGDCFIRVYRLFTTIFHKCLILLLIILHFTIILALSLMLSMTNYAGIIGESLCTMLFLKSGFNDGMLRC